MDIDIGMEASRGDAPMACTSTAETATGQALEWVDLRRRATSMEVHRLGVRMTFPASLAADVDDLARRESECCTFLTISTSVEGEALTLDISSANPEALPVIRALAGIVQS